MPRESTMNGLSHSSWAVAVARGFTPELAGVVVKRGAVPMAVADAAAAAAGGVVGDAGAPVAAPPVVGGGFRWPAVITMADSLSAGLGTPDGMLGLDGASVSVDIWTQRIPKSTPPPTKTTPAIAIATRPMRGRPWLRSWSSSTDGAGVRLLVARSVSRSSSAMLPRSSFVMARPRSRASPGPSVGTTPLVTSIGELGESRRSGGGIELEVSLSMRWTSSCRQSSASPATEWTHSPISRAGAGASALLERRSHLARGRPPVLRVALEALHHDGVEPGREVGDDRARRLDLLVDDRVDERRHVVGLEEALARERLPEDDRRRVDVRATIDGALRELLRGHVRDLALDLVGASLLDAVRGLRDAEVEQARHAVRADVHVLWRHVAMDEAERLALLALRVVRGVQALERAGHDADHVARRDVLAALARFANEPRERLACDVLHDEEQLAVVGDDVERGDDVRVPDARREPRLLEEHRDELGVLGEVRMQALDRDRAREADGPEQAREMDCGHTAGGDLAVQRVSPQTSAVIRAGLLRHWSERLPPMPGASKEHRPRAKR